jgi:hypothetical protein
MKLRARCSREENEEEKGTQLNGINLVVNLRVE